jgi:folate-binding protein YgfZ
LFFSAGRTSGYFEPVERADAFRTELIENGAIELIGDDHEVRRIENGIPKYGIDMDETTIVPELGIEEMISYKKGCYVGQEIIARIHFRGHVAKRLTGILSEPGTVATGLRSASEPGAVATGFSSGVELTTPDGKNAGRITSVTFSPKLNRMIALAYVRYDYLTAGTGLMAGDQAVAVADLPFIGDA